jgi:hypothetical protein
LPLTAVGSNPDCNFGLFHVRKLFSYLMERWWFYSGVLFMPEIMHGRAPEVFLHQLKLESHHMTYTVLVLGNEVTYIVKGNSA